MTLDAIRYNIAARNMGIRHTVSKDLQVESHLVIIAC